MRPDRYIAHGIALLLLAGCAALPPARDLVAQIPAGPVPDTQVRTQPLAPPGTCADQFAAQRLPYTTLTSEPIARLFESNGSGVAVGDLDRDGLADLVFANLAGPSAILWNQGGLQFVRQDLDDTRTRGVALIDQDGDQQLDIAFTHRAAGVSLWRNQGARQFALASLPVIRTPAYSMAWADLNGDERLDLVTGSYDAELAKETPNAFLNSSGGGVMLYQSRADGYESIKLAGSAQALAIALLDLDHDGRRDILVGNDFDLPDMAWVQGDSGWLPAEPFATTSHSTMSFDWGDIDNSGSPALFATDMKPFAIDVATLSAWLPMMQKMPQRHAPGDRQTMANVLQVAGGDGSWHEEAATRRVDATGWSWSGTLGDLDRDGYLDLYVVNGMQAPELFPHLPDNELVEANQAFQNDRRGRFLARPDWGLGGGDGGRGMQQADLDNDGDLDIVVNNLGAPATLFENRLCGGAGLLVALEWPQSGNTSAIGAQVVLRTSAGRMVREVKSSTGYLSSADPRMHFGLPAGAQIQLLEVHWPDGAISTVDGVHAQQLVTIARH